MGGDRFGLWLGASGMVLGVPRTNGRAAFWGFEPADPPFRVWQTQPNPCPRRWRGPRRRPPPLLIPQYTRSRSAALLVGGGSDESLR